MWNSEVKQTLISGGSDSDAEVRRNALGALRRLAWADKNRESMWNSEVKEVLIL
jgi:hypothetical protein